MKCFENQQCQMAEWEIVSFGGIQTTYTILESRSLPTTSQFALARKFYLPASPKATGLRPLLYSIYTDKHFWYGCSSAAISCFDGLQVFLK